MVLFERSVSVHIFVDYDVCFLSLFVQETSPNRTIPSLEFPTLAAPSMAAPWGTAFFREELCGPMGMGVRRQVDQ
jgi:hypothetical protein